ncbi:MAG: 23S rRNA (pseudouridine(1915)-N(3))-methyltransferase RlmH [Thermoleophilum sp.]|nr:23S rRNA (pseudouridine(1915)-N(3))-methyltransferase RlmH [Thermoleophilum sp.]
MCVVGKPKLGYAKAGVEEYSSRLNKTGRFELVQVREGKQNEESLRLLEASQSYLRVVLDERGELADTLTRGAYVLPARLMEAGFSFEYPTLEAALQDLLHK